ncbi:hypothetical protein [Leekyejoonella antrihumi]|uniref:Uncharacterized protein n=1 Tax=Leekyejoonella antrihumi TaxID=1660198 RepID=A0A563E438_9MICO|nr:hypothetical protein [Leekyejoonella antrihumi]TWP36971.1 hypothetical protein FGL98_07890 [Leekyejoonella antrihumi]
MVSSETVRVVGVPADRHLIRQWRGWFAPEVQPFVVNEQLRAIVGEGLPLEMSMELQDTFLLYDQDQHSDLVGLTHEVFTRLGAETRAALVRYQVVAGRRAVPTLRSTGRQLRNELRVDGDGYRFVWWPDTLDRAGDEPLLRFVADDMLPSQHARVGAETWRQAAAVLPGARDLAGTFARSSGPNCFGTVMATAGVPAAAEQWMTQEPFEQWLSDNTGPGGGDHQAGTVLVWRDRQGTAQHAAVVLGDGWAMHKPSQGWMTPRKVLAVDDLKRRARQAGHRLSRRLIARR